MVMPDPNAFATRLRETPEAAEEPGLASAEAKARLEAGAQALAGGLRDTFRPWGEMPESGHRFFRNLAMKCFVAMNQRPS